jgi:hypothetical protein
MGQNDRFKELMITLGWVAAVVVGVVVLSAALQVLFPVQMTLLRMP